MQGTAVRDTAVQDTKGDLPEVGSPAGNGSSVSLMLVDDASELRSLLRKLLERSGLIKVTAEASDTTEASERIDALQPDVVLLDLAMPGGGALELIESLRSAERPVTIVVLSGYPAATTAAECIERGADLYLEKGLPTSQLVSSILEAHRARHRGRR